MHEKNLALEVLIPLIPLYLAGEDWFSQENFCMCTPIKAKTGMGLLQESRL